MFFPTLLCGSAFAFQRIYRLTISCVNFKVPPHQIPEGDYPPAGWRMALDEVEVFGDDELTKVRGYRGYRGYIYTGYVVDTVDKGVIEDTCV